jgi:hypothetical protein
MNNTVRPSLENSRWSVKIISVLFDFDILSRMTRSPDMIHARLVAGVADNNDYLFAFTRK